MTEPRIPYLDNQIICERCKRVVGRLVSIDGLEFVEIGCITFRNGRGICKCGAPFHYSVSDRQFEKLMRGVIEKD
jgi:hypothetical protein